MDLSRPLPLLSLALSNAAKGPMSRYSLMTQINQICSKIEGPYSPGAVYHCIKQLGEARMIEINHSTPEITPLGLESLIQHLTEAPLPPSWTCIVYRILATQLLPESGSKEKAKARLEVEMIKYNHYPLTDSVFGDIPPSTRKALNICQINISTAIKKIVLDISAQ